MVPYPHPEVEKAAPTPLSLLSDEEFREELEDRLREVIAAEQEGMEDLYFIAHRELDKILLPIVLNISGSKFHTAKMLGISRMTLRKKMEAAGVSYGRQK